MMRLNALIALHVTILSMTLAGQACASDSRSLDDQVHWQWNLYSPFAGNWLYADVQANVIDRLLVLLTHIREGRQADAIRLLEEDLTTDAKSFDHTIAELDKAKPQLSDRDREARDRAREVSKRLLDYKEKYVSMRD